LSISNSFKHLNQDEGEDDASQNALQPKTGSGGVGDGLCLRVAGAGFKSGLFNGMMEPSKSLMTDNEFAR
jgi:hypothetical protein